MTPAGAKIALEAKLEELKARQADEPEVEELRLLTIHAIGRALKRLDVGTWGDCLGCGHAIAPKRLESLPWVEYCVFCANAREREALRTGRSLDERIAEEDDALREDVAVVPLDDDPADVPVSEGGYRETGMRMGRKRGRPRR